MSTFKDGWAKERDEKRKEREQKQFARRMLSPVARGEVFRLGELQAEHIASLALAVEALEDLLVGRGLLEPDELMDTMRVMAAAKAEQMAAAQVAGPAPV